MKSRNRDIILKKSPYCAILLTINSSHAQEGHFYDLQLYNAIKILTDKGTKRRKYACRQASVQTYFLK